MLHRGGENEFHAYKTLDDFPHERSVLHILRRCAYLVGPIMQRHGWTIPLLSELSPSEDKYGTMRHELRVTVTKSTRFGVTTNTKRQVLRIPVELLLRVRCPQDPSKLVSIDQIMCTLLHELTHLRYRAHLLGFYRLNARLLDEFWRDVKDRRIRGVKEDEIPTSVCDSNEMRRAMTKSLVQAVLSILKVDDRGSKQPA